jgi:hypothetical protein
MIQDIYCESWIKDPDFFPPGSRGQKSSDPESAVFLRWIRVGQKSGARDKHLRSPTQQLLKFLTYIIHAVHEEDRRWLVSAPQRMPSTEWIGKQRGQQEWCSTISLYKILYVCSINLKINETSGSAPPNLNLNLKKRR